MQNIETQTWSEVYKKKSYTSTQFQLNISKQVGKNVEKCAFPVV